MAAALHGSVAPNAEMRRKRPNSSAGSQTRPTRASLPRNNEGAGSQTRPTKSLAANDFYSGSIQDTKKNFGSIYMVLHDGSLIQNNESSFVWFVVRTRDRRSFSLKFRYKAVCLVPTCTSLPRG